MFVSNTDKNQVGNWEKKTTVALKTHYLEEVST